MDYLDKYNAGASEGAVLEIMAPNGEPVVHPESGPLTITLLSRDHPDVRALWRKKLNEAIQKAQDGKGGLDEDDSGDLDVLAAATIDWTVHDTKCTPANVRSLYARHIWIREQVERFYSSRANFLPASSNGS